MTIKFQDVVERVTQRVFATHDGTQPADDAECDRWRAIVKFTIEEIGMHVSDSGEVCDPRPRPSSVPEQRNARWGGGRRRR